jgi:hypothetical protein
MTTLRILKAFAWMRWRMLVNSLEHTGSRDALERFSLAIEKLGPILAAILLVPSAIFMAGLGVAAGYLLATGGSLMAITAARFILIAAPLLAIVGPFFLPAADRTNPVRLLLLPIPGSTLYVAQSSAALGDPWNVLMIPLVAGVPAGILAAGDLAGAFITLVAAIFFVALVIGLSALATSLLHLIARDRRRGELAALIFIVIVPVVAMLPGLLEGESRRGGGPDLPPIVPEWIVELGARAKALYPSELFVSAATHAVNDVTGRASAAVSGLAIATLLVHALGIFAFGRVLASPGTTGARRGGQTSAVWGARLPGLSPGASAVALAQLRLALRTPRGRSILLSPLAMFGIFALLMYRGSGEMAFGPFQFGSGLGLATFASFICLLSILPIAMNQFAIDKAGLTMTLLSPLRDDEILSGKAAGNALIVMGPTTLSVAAALVLFGGGSAALWLTLVLGLLSIYLLVAPVAAMCSAVFPRSVDLNSIGRGSNAHGAAGFIGMLAFVAAGAIPGLLAFVAIRLMERPSAAPLLVAGWCLLAYIAGRFLFVAARRVFATRRENLAMVG